MQPQITKDITSDIVVLSKKQVVSGAIVMFPETDIHQLKALEYYLAIADPPPSNADELREYVIKAKLRFEKVKNSNAW